MFKKLRILDAITRGDPLEKFHRFFNNLQAPITLCEGLEIVALNDAAKQMFADRSTVLIGTRVNSLFFDTSTADNLFGSGGAQVSIFLDDKKFLLTASPWRENLRFWLIEWQDQTLLETMSHQLQVTRNHDVATGTLLPSNFNNLLQARFEEAGTGILAHVQLNNFDLSAEGMNNCILGLVDQISHEFGDSVLISRHDTYTLAISMSTGFADPDEHSYILRQLNRICTRLLAPETPLLALAVYPNDGQSVTALNKSVRLAMDDAKEHSRPTIYTSEMGDEDLRFAQLANDMDEAIAINQITPHFQPIVDSKTGKIKSFEALVRWVHPKHGYIIPPDIIQIAIGNNLLNNLTEHILLKTIEQAKQWPSNIQFAINVIPSQLTGDLINLVRKSVRVTGIDPARLEIEVTEDAIINDWETSETIFSRLRSIGVTVSMDDFGAGYTSVANITKLDFNKIKIDKSISDGLPHDNRSVAIVKSMMLMCSELNIEITVEGIEEQDQVDFLRSYKCGIQGYFFSRPLPAKDMPSMQKFLGLEDSTVVINDKKAG